MSNRDELDALMMLARAMSGEANVLEHMEAEGQQKAVKYTMVAKRMRPNREVWEKLGFTFSDIPGDDVLCKAELPEGWYLEATSHSMWSNIIDEQERTRGSMFYKAAFYDRDANMSLSSRYDVCSDYIDDNYTKIEVYFGNENEKLFVAGQVCTPRDASRELRIANYREEERLRELAKKFAEENYPDWQDVTAYWDEEKEISDETTMTR